MKNLLKLEKPATPEIGKKVLQDTVINLFFLVGIAGMTFVGVIMFVLQ